MKKTILVAMAIQMFFNSAGFAANTESKNTEKSSESIQQQSLATATEKVQKIIQMFETNSADSTKIAFLENRMNEMSEDEIEALLVLSMQKQQELRQQISEVKPRIQNASAEELLQFTNFTAAAGIFSESILAVWYLSGKNYMKPTQLIATKRLALGFAALIGVSFYGMSDAISRLRETAEMNADLDKVRNDLFVELRKQEILSEQIEAKIRTQIIDIRVKRRVVDLGVQ